MDARELPENFLNSLFRILPIPSFVFLRFLPRRGRRGIYYTFPVILRHIYRCIFKAKTVLLMPFLRLAYIRFFKLYRFNFLDDISHYLPCRKCAYTLNIISLRQKILHSRKKMASGRSSVSFSLCLFKFFVSVKISGRGGARKIVTHARDRIVSSQLTIHPTRSSADRLSSVEISIATSILNFAFFSLLNARLPART